MKKFMFFAAAAMALTLGSCGGSDKAADAPKTLEVKNAQFSGNNLSELIELDTTPVEYTMTDDGNQISTQYFDAVVTVKVVSDALKGCPVKELEIIGTGYSSGFDVKVFDANDHEVNPGTLGLREDEVNKLKDALVKGKGTTVQLKVEATTNNSQDAPKWLNDAVAIKANKAGEYKTTGSFVPQKGTDNPANSNPMAIDGPNMYPNAEGPEGSYPEGGAPEGGAPEYGLPEGGMY